MKILAATLVALLPLSAFAGTYTFSDTSGATYSSNGTSTSTTTTGDGTASTLDDLVHGTAYTWGFTNASLGTGTQLTSLESSINTGSQTITSAYLTITGVSDWTKEPDDVLYVDILNGVETGANYTEYDSSPTTTDHSYGTDPFVSGSTLSNGLGHTASGNTPQENQDGTFYGAGHTGVTDITYDTAASGSTILASQEKLGGWTATGPGTFTANNTLSSFTITYQLTAAQVALLNNYLATDSGTLTDLGLGLGPDCHFSDTGITLTVNTSVAGVPDRGMTVIMLGGALIALGALGRFLPKRSPLAL